MSAYFRKSFKVAPGVHLNLSKRGTGISIGGRGAHVSFSPTGRVTKTVSIPGTGIYYRDVSTANSRSKDSKSVTPPPETSAPSAPSAHQVAAVEHHGFFISHSFAALFSILASILIQTHYGLHPMNAWEPPLLAIGAISLILWLRDLAQSSKERKS